MAVLSGSQSYLALEDFGQRHYPALREKLDLKTDKAPSDTTYRRILRQLDFQDLSAQFHNWMKQYVKLEAGEWLSLDGKSIKGTVSNYDNSYQNLVTLVSLYSHHQGIVVALKAFENKNQSEQKVVQYLLETLHLEGVIVTLDALHTQKKTILATVFVGEAQAESNYKRMQRFLTWLDKARKPRHPPSASFAPLR